MNNHSISSTLNALECIEVLAELVDGLFSLQLDKQLGDRRNPGAETESFGPWGRICHSEMYGILMGVQKVTFALCVCIGALYSLKGKGLC